MVKEKRKQRIIYNYEAGKEPIRIKTLTTYRKFKKRFPDSVYFRKRHKDSKIQIKRTYDNQRFPEKAFKRKEEEKRERIITSQIKQDKEIQKEIFEQRVRKQVVLNLRSDEEPYAASIRAITTNPEITENGLKMAIIETFKELNFDMDSFWKKEFGYSSQIIPQAEDKRLNDYRVHIEVFIKKNPPLNFIK